MAISRKNYPHLEQPVGPYVHAVKHNGLLYLSGLSAFGSVAQGKDIASQTQAIFSQIESIAVAEKTDLSSLIKVTIFVTTFDEIAKLREVLFQYYGSHLPASSLVQVARLFSPEISIEIEAILAVT